MDCRILAIFVFAAFAYITKVETCCIDLSEVQKHLNTSISGDLVDYTPKSDEEKEKAGKIPAAKAKMESDDTFKCLKQTAEGHGASRKKRQTSCGTVDGYRSWYNSANNEYCPSYYPITYGCRGTCPDYDHYHYLYYNSYDLYQTYQYRSCGKRCCQIGRMKNVVNFFFCPSGDWYYAYVTNVDYCSCSYDRCY